MTAEPIEPGRRRPPVPRKVGAIRAALPDDQRAIFAAELEAARLDEVPELLRTWWARAVLAPDAERIEATFAAARAGTLALIHPAEVVPGWEGD